MKTTIISITLAWVLGISCTKEPQEPVKNKVRLVIKSHNVEKLSWGISPLNRGCQDKKIKLNKNKIVSIDTTFNLLNNEGVCVLMEIKDLPELELGTIELYRADTLVKRIENKSSIQFSYTFYE